MLQHQSNPHVYRKTTSFWFDDPSHFRFIEMGSVREGEKSVHTIGDVCIKPADGQVESGVRVDLEYCVSDQSLMTLIEVQTSENILNLKIPTRVSGLRGPCISIIATIWIPPGLVLNSMNIETLNLGIIYHPFLDYTVRGTTYLSSAHGSVSMSSPSPNVYSRETIIRTSSGSITGKYPLYDLLSVHTVSGSIGIHVDPKGADAHAPAPASFIASTTSGSISVSYPINPDHAPIPNRDYRVAVKTISGTISGAYLHGTSSAFTTTSGSIAATLAPYTLITDPTSIRTQSTSGSARLTLLPSLTSPEAPMRNLSSSHEHTSGSLHLHFPPRWEGEIDGETMSGSLDVKWDGVRIIRDRKHGPWRRLLARKGDEQAQGKIRFRGMSARMVVEGD